MKKYGEGNRKKDGQRKSTAISAYILWEGVMVLQKYEVMNYIEIDGREVLIDSLPEEEKRRIAYVLQEKIMAAAGYQRRPGSNTC